MKKEVLMWMLIVLVLLTVGLLNGCSSWVKVTKVEDGIVFKSNRPFDASYKDDIDKVDASASTKGKGFFEGIVQPKLK